MSCCTRSITDLSQAVFDETFRLAVASTKLDTKTLQISVHARHLSSDSQEDCMVIKKIYTIFFFQLCTVILNLNSIRDGHKFLWPISVLIPTL